MRRKKRLPFPFFAAFIKPENAQFLTLDAPDNGNGNGGGTNAGGGSSAAGTEGETDNDGETERVNDNPPVAAHPQIDPTKFHSAVKRRQKASFLAKAIAHKAGISLDDVQVIETGDKANPFKIIGLEDDAESNSVAGKPNKPRSNPQVERLKRERSALIDWIRTNVVASRIRTACAKHGAVDDDGGMYEDIVNLILPKFVCNVDFEEGAAQPEVITYAVDAVGEPIEGATEESLVAELLKRKPKFRKPDFRPGTGAGGSSIGGNNPRKNGTPGSVVSSNQNGNSKVPAHVATAGQQFFGKRINI
jgi:hypothetical protein